MAIKSSVAETTSAAISFPAALLRFEGFTVFVSAIIAFAHLGGSGLLFVVLLFAPDLSMVGYLRDPRLGGMTYNVVHTYAVPAALAAAMLVIGSTTGIEIALIWVAHIGLDRLLGFGLKYPTAFKDTHFQRI